MSLLLHLRTTQRVRSVVMVILGISGLILTRDCRAANNINANQLDSLWVDTQNVDISSSATVESLLRLPVRRIIVSTFSNGHTLQSFPDTIFPQDPHYLGKPNTLSQFIAKAHVKGIRVFAALDCFHWTTIGQKDDILAKHPDMRELDVRGGCGAPNTDEYASPFNARVLGALVKLAALTGRTNPSLDGLVVNGSLLSGTILGYSDAAREQYIAAAHIDPIDIDFGKDVADARLTAAWFTWRIKHVGVAIDQVAVSFKTAIRKATILVVGDANWPFQVPGQRNTTLNAWPDWLGSGNVEGVLLFSSGSGTLAGTSNKLPRIDTLSDMAHSHNALAEIDILVRFHDEGRTVDPVDGLATMSYQGKEPVVVRVESDADVTNASEFLLKLLPTLRAAVTGSSSVPIRAASVK